MVMVKNCIRGNVIVLTILFDRPMSSFTITTLLVHNTLPLPNVLPSILRFHLGVADTTVPAGAYISFLSFILALPLSLLCLLPPCFPLHV